MTLAAFDSADAVRAAIAEFDDVGRHAFLEKYGFGEARKYFLVVAGREYDSKAIVGAAHGYQFPGLGPLRPSDFSGGELTVARKLRALGFEVGAVSVGRNPPWDRDELVLALDLYLRGGLLDDSDPRVVELSAILNNLPLHPLRPDAARFRNANGVALKLANFAALDPRYPGVGMARGGRGDRETWDALADQPAEVARLAAAIRAETTALVLGPEEGEDEAIEGRLLFRRHRVRERDRRLVLRKKERVVREMGRLACEVCSFDFGLAYGHWGEGFIECHHLLPLGHAGGSVTTRLADLVVVCSNCHRVLHRGSPAPTVEDLRVFVGRQ